MKKLVFSALACVAFAGSAFASNEVVVEKQELKSEKSVELEIVESNEKPCNFRVTGRDAYGRSFVSSWRTVENTTQSGCDGAKNAKIKELEKLGAKIDKVDSTWGS